MNSANLAILLGATVTACSLMSSSAQLTQITAGDIAADAVTTDFEAFPTGSVAGNDPLFQAGNIASAAVIGTGVTIGDPYSSNTSGNALAVNGAGLTIAVPGDDLYALSMGEGWVINFVNPASQFGFGLVDIINLPLLVEAYSGATLIGSLTYTNTSGIEYFQTDTLIDSFRVTGTSMAEVGQGIDDIVIGRFTILVPSNPTDASSFKSKSKSKSKPTYLFTNTGAILSTNISGLGMGLVNQQVTQNAPNAALRDLNGRLFRSRSGWDNPAALASAMGGDSSLLRYLAFVKDQNMSYKVALGLADAEEHMIEVTMADTLSAQIGSNYNGQAMGGGLPYAMMGVPMVGGAATTVRIVEAASSGKTVIDDSKAVVENEKWSRWELFAAGDFSFYDQDQLTGMMQGFDTETYAGTIGLEYRMKSWLNIGLAWSYLQSDTDVSGNFGNIDLEGNLITGYATAFWRQYWADVLYSYGSFNNDLRRNTGLGSSVRGDTDSRSHNIRLNFGRNFNLGRNIVTGPIAGLRYSNGDIDGYSETGRSSAALNYDGTDFETMVSSLGWQATHTHSTTWGRLVSQAHLSWEHEYMPENGTVSAALQTSPFALVTGGRARSIGGYTATSDGAHAGTDWLSAGTGLRFELANGLSLSTDYEGVFFRSHAAQHYVSAKLSYEWGVLMPKGNKKSLGSGKAVDYEAYDTSAQQLSGNSVAETASNPVLVAEKKNSAGDFSAWLNRKGR